jgi:hypothetical protein
VEKHCDRGWIVEDKATPDTITKLYDNSFVHDYRLQSGLGRNTVQI